MRIPKMLAAALMLATFAARAELEITVTGGDVAALPIAIVPFGQVPEAGLDIAQVVHNDLERSGRFRVLKRQDMLQRPVQPQGVNYPTWRSQGMDNLVVGQVARAENGGLYARFFLLDTVRGAQLLGQEIPIRDISRLREVAHYISDQIYEKLLGVPGYFNTKIAYIASSGLGYQRRFQLMMADADGENPREIAASREPLMSPAWSPDRKQLAFVGYERGRSAIYIYTLATGQVRKLIAEPGINGSPAWSPDGKRMAITLSFENNPDIYIVDLVSGARRRITDHYGIDTEPNWSPDGSKLVFTSDRGGRPQVYEISASGGDPRRVTFLGTQNQDASYSPDGKSLALVNTEGGRFRIGLLDLASGEMRLISDGRLDESPSFAPGGAVVIFATQGARGAELATVSVDGRVRQSLRQAGDVREPSWSPLLR
ncbi:MAG TPA: Tol-Pal system beta propeller repeat protein TolB [Solimonas sp.]|nr:Tol-Pal system beta propeller repeat protein TolB [Solimonas sp.]